MFIHCSRNLHIKEGSETLNLRSGFIGEIDDRWAKHWFIQAALQDGTIEAADSGKSKAKAAKTTKDGGEDQTADSGKTE